MTHTLLLADDSVTIQRVIELTFVDEDIRVLAVGDGDQAIAVLDKTPPDIVLADVGMPGKNGYEVAQHIRETPGLAHIPVLLLTGAFEPIDHARAAEVGCDGVLAKPFEPQLVIGKVKELLARPKPALAPPPPQTSALPSPAKATSVVEEPPVAHRDVRAPAPVEVDQYFDRLDQAFANLSTSGPAGPSQAEPRSLADQIDWFAGTPAVEAPKAAPDQWDAAASPSFAADFPLAPPPPVSPAAMPSPPPPLPIAAPPMTLPPLADAFAALLAAEQSVPSPSAAALWPAPPAVSTEDVIDQAVRRAFDRMPDRVIRETVSDIVCGVAERLVREEIERIKASLK